MRASSRALEGRLPLPDAAAPSLAFRFALCKLFCDVPWLSTAPAPQEDASHHVVCQMYLENKHAADAEAETQEMLADY